MISLKMTCLAFRGRIETRTSASAAGDLRGFMAGDVLVPIESGTPNIVAVR